MNGIAGVVGLGGAPAGVPDLRAITAAQAERGSAGEWAQGPAALAGVEVESLVVSADVRLDDREALTASLGAPADAADVELLARGYARWGARLPERLLGDFAFAVWDPARRTLLCARDVFGVRPFVYARAGDRFAFASRPAALLALPWMTRRVDELAIARFLVDDLRDAEGSFWEGVLRLPPGHLLEIADGAAHAPRPFFRFDPFADAPAASPEEHAEAFRERFLAAVGFRMAVTSAPGELGVEVSGGLDSASVAGAALTLGAPRPLAAYSAIFADSPADERSFVEAVVGAGGLRSVTISEADLVPGGRVRDLVSGDVDSPFTLIGPLTEGAILRRAAAEGTGVLLSGFDGDTVVSHGLGRLTDLAVGGRAFALARELRALHRNLGWGAWSTFRSHVLGPLAPGRTPGARDPLAGSPIDRAFARSVGLLDTSERKAERRRRPHARREHHADLTAGINAATLEVLDHAAARAGVELRHPFFDRPLAELCLSLPADVKLRDGWPRWVQRRAMEGLVPEAVRRRPDKGVLGPELSTRWLRPEWNELTRIARDGGAAAGYLDRGELRALYRRVAAGSGPDAAGTLWAVLLLEWWLAAAS